MTKRARKLLGGILLALMSTYFGVYIYSITLPRKGSSDGWSATWEGRGEPRVISVDPNGPATSLQLGDEFIAINGVKIKDDPGLLSLSDRVPPGTRYTLTIRRGGELRDVVIQTIPHQGRVKFDRLYYVNLLFLLTAWIIFLLRPDDKQAWLLALMLGTLAIILGNDPANLPSWLSVAVLAAVALGLLFLPVFVHFFLIFPDPSPLLRRWPRLEIWVYLPYLLILLPVIVPLRLPGGVWLFRFQWYRYTVFAVNFLIVAHLAAGLICLLINYRAASLIARRRLRVVMAGSAVGFFNLFLLGMGGVSGLQPRMPTIWSWFYTALFVTLPLVPLSFVYAILRHKVIPVSLIIRRGLRYLLVSRGSVLLLMIVVSVVMYIAMDAFFNWNPMSGRRVGIISAVVAIAVWQLARAFHLRVVAPKIDRLFFHQAYDARQIIAELAESLRATTSLSQLLELAATKIQSALHASNVAVLLRDESSGDYSCAYFCVYSFHNRRAGPYPCDGGLTRDSAVIRRLVESSQLIDLEGRDDLQAENGGSNELSGADREALRKLNSAMLLPITAKGGLLGVISVGGHLGDLPFSSDDKRLLLSVVTPTSFALENIRLIERTVEDARRTQELAAENEQRARELEEARQLQLSMLPKSIPQLPHVEIAALMKTATEVGGDYYDFHVGADGALTIAIGDATGHGLKAGTVVAATKGLFKHLAGQADLVATLAQTSRALKQMNLRPSFMALTLVKLNGDHLQCSVAGMPPILIYRAATQTIEEIPLHGAPLGGLSSYDYRQAELTLAVNDTVLLLSDGLPERFNAAGEMFGYERMRELLLAHASADPQILLERLLQAGDEWAAGKLADDDMTFVALRRKATGSS